MGIVCPRCYSEDTCEHDYGRHFCFNCEYYFPHYENDMHYGYLKRVKGTWNDESESKPILSKRSYLLGVSNETGGIVYNGHLERCEYNGGEYLYAHCEPETDYDKLLSSYDDLID